MNGNDIKSMAILIDEAKQTAKMQEDLIMDDLTGYGIDPEKVRNLVVSEELESELTDEKVAEIFDTIGFEDSSINMEFFAKEEDSEQDTKRRCVEYAIASINDVITSKENLESLQAEANEEIKSYTDYICSAKFDEHRVKNIETWKSMLERETNPGRMHRLKKAIYILENRYTLEFMFERLHDEKTAKKEHRVLVENFFSNERSNYMMEKFAVKCKQFNFTGNLYRYLLDIEERYLEEKYHVFNNFFLFTAMRFIGHCDESEIDMAKEVIQCMLNLVYNRFYSDEVRDTFLNTIRSFLDEFMDEKEIFEKDNILQPNHPYRIRKKKEKDAKLRAGIYAELTKNNYVDISEQQDELDAMDINELIAFYNERKNEAESAKEEDSSKEEETDGSDTESQEEDANTSDEVAEE